MTPEILLVLSPGVEIEAYTPLVQALKSGGAEVTPVGFPCSGDAESLAAQVARAGAGRPVVVMAHGLGATLALSAADELDVRRWVLMGPVLDVVAGPGLERLAALDPGESVDLGTLPADALHIWLGADEPDHLGCLSSALARDVQQWIRTGHVPVEPGAVTEPVVVTLGLLDEVATLEATLPDARLFPAGEVVRMGISRMDPADYRHMDLVTEPAPVRVAVQAALEAE